MARAPNYLKITGALAYNAELSGGLVMKA